MGIGIAVAIAVTATVATVGADIGFSVEEKKKQEELKRDVERAQTSASNAKSFYEDIYKVVRSRLVKLQQSMKKLPARVVDKLGSALTLDLNEPEAIQYAGWALGGGSAVTGIVTSVTSYLLSTEAFAANDILASIGAVASAAGAVIAVAGFGLTLYNGITELKKLDDAIHKVNEKWQQAEDAIKKMQDSLNVLLKSMHLEAGSYQRLKEISNDWYTLSKNFDEYSTSFYYAVTGFAMGKTQAEVKIFLNSRGAVGLKDDVLVLAKLIQQNIFDMMKNGKTDEQIINYYAKENPHEGLRFLMDPFFVDSLRAYNT